MLVVLVVSVPIEVMILQPTLCTVVNIVARIYHAKAKPIRLKISTAKMNKVCRIGVNP